MSRAGETLSQSPRRVFIPVDQHDMVATHQTHMVGCTDHQQLSGIMKKTESEVGGWVM
jgi:hypothetical protein